MALFLDSADLEEIRSGMELGIYSGVTTNPTLLSRVPPKERFQHLGSIAEICSKSIYLQVDLKSFSEMEDQALTLFGLAPGRAVIKVPMAEAGLRLCQQLKGKDVPVCITAVFSPAQAFAAAAAGAHAVAIYVGRLARRGEDGVEVVRKTSEILQAVKLPARVLAASLPDVDTLTALLSIPGVDATIPFRLQPPLLHHPGTQEAIEEFARAGAQSG